MRVAMDKDYKRYYTINEVDVAKRIIKQEKEEDESTPAEWAEYAVREALRGTNKSLCEVITATARISKNCRAWDAYFEGSWNLDIWIEALARTTEGYIEIGAYLSDIWQTGANHYVSNMFVRRFAEVETA